MAVPRLHSCVTEIAEFLLTSGVKMELQTVQRDLMVPC